MAFAQGSRSSLSSIAETAFGTTPAAPTFALLPINSHSLDLTKDRVEGNEIQADRMPRVDRHGNVQAGGSLEVDLRKGDFDGLIESVMMNTWDSSPAAAPDLIKVGITQKFFTMEDHAQDITQFRLLLLDLQEELLQQLQPISHSIVTQVQSLMVVLALQSLRQLTSL